MSGWNHSNLRSVSFILGIWYGLCLGCLFKLLNFLRKWIIPLSGLGCTNDISSHLDSFTILRNPRSTRRSTYNLKDISCTFCYGCGCDHTGYASSFSSNYTVSVKFIFRLLNLSHCVHKSIFKCLQFSLMVLSKPVFYIWHQVWYVLYYWHHTQVKIHLTGLCIHS